MKRIAIQGLIGSFHDIAAHLYFEGEQIQLICCSTFEQGRTCTSRENRYS